MASEPMANEQMAIAEKLTLRRARAAIVLGILFITSMATSLKVDIGDSRPATVQLVAWIFWAAALLFLVAVGGGLFRGRFVRSVMNDESTIANRRTAMVTGFWAIVLCAFFLYGISLIEEMSARAAIRIMLSVAVGAAAIRFGTLERRALHIG
jgi:protein-S-isoprenylcysteine O-methyltransferase Ste14